MTDGYESVLVEFPLFKGFTENGALSVLNSGEIVTLAKGDLLFQEGGEPDSVILILEGSVEVFVVRNGTEIALTTLGAGTMIGELAVLCEIPRAASVRVDDDTTVLRWSAWDFRRLLLRNPQLSKGVFGAALKVVLDNQQALIEKLARQQDAD